METFAAQEALKDMHLYEEEKYEKIGEHQPWLPNVLRKSEQTEKKIVKKPHTRKGANVYPRDRYDK
eukprot:UN08456